MHCCPSSVTPKRLHPVAACHRMFDSPSPISSMPPAIAIPATAVPAPAGGVNPAPVIAPAAMAIGRFSPTSSIISGFANIGLTAAGAAAAGSPVVPESPATGAVVGIVVSPAATTLPQVGISSWFSGIPKAADRGYFNLACCMTPSSVDPGINPYIHMSALSTPSVRSGKYRGYIPAAINIPAAFESTPSVKTI